MRKTTNPFEPLDASQAPTEAALKRIPSIFFSTLGGKRLKSPLS